MNKPLFTILFLLVSYVVFGQKQFDLELGTSRWNVYDPGQFNMKELATIDLEVDDDLLSGNVNAISARYHVSHYYLDLTRHEFYGRHKRTELALGLGLSMSFRDRNAASSYHEYLRKESISGGPDQTHFRSTDKVWVSLYDRYNAFGIGPKIVARAHLSQRLSINAALNGEVGGPFNNEYLALITTVRKDEWTSEDAYSFTEHSNIQTKIIDMPGQWHVAVNGHMGLSYKLLDNSKFFFELGMNYGARRFYRNEPRCTEKYYSPSVGFRAYL